MTAQTAASPRWCRFCRAADVPLMRTRDGWQCLDGIDCYGRQETVRT